MSTRTFRTGQLLVATPLTGGAFRQTVVLLLHHDHQGAHGLVLNRPMEAEVGAVLPDWQPHVTEPARLFQGGPVGADTAMGLVAVPAMGQGEAPLGISALFGSIGLVDLDAPPPVVAAEVGALRIFVGYAGWSSGQLEEEIDEGGWYVVERAPTDPFDAEPEMMWAQVLRRQRSTLSLVLTHTDRPELN